MIVKTKIEFTWDTDDFDERLLAEFSSDPVKFEEETIQYAIDCMVDDVYNMVKYNEVTDAIRIEVIK